ncbi:hypothetical protein C8J56DRAFT_884015 [Mycena floridula]|nr:hypothetical protein C8J56DRAFT_884015 [Mycena floridula]
MTASQREAARLAYNIPAMLKARILPPETASIQTLCEFKLPPISPSLPTISAAAFFSTQAPAIMSSIMGEHSVMDGTPAVRLCDEVLDWITDPNFDHGTTTTNLTPKSMDWEVSSATTKAIDAANTAAVELIDSQELTFHLTSYERVGRMKLLRQDVSSREGQAIRAVTSQSDAWVQSMDQPNVSDEQRKQLFDAATKKHVELTESGGMGLKKLMEADEETPTFGR